MAFRLIVKLTSSLVSLYHWFINIGWSLVYTEMIKLKNPLNIMLSGFFKSVTLNLFQGLLIDAETSSA